ncbi:phage major capsid protein [Methyloligella sp. GL2]|uniref:phage major capsid protein n=2 Tax=unclassified Methyloligella TaxID=2625955 RepID=UPI00157C46CE|nr:phage major capsid protein [Methyloligella sp. GL2]QKP78748.1 phage major capsid protein [Methyloligella sp. GL2]
MRENDTSQTTEHGFEPGLETKAGYETKAGGTGNDVAYAFDEFMRTFEAFKEQNDERLDTLEKRIPVDALTEQKLDRINTALDEQKQVVDQLALKASRPQLGEGGEGASSPALLQHKAAFHSYMRKGETGNLTRLEEKALKVNLSGSGADGGYLVPPEVETAVIRGVKEISPIRAISGSRTVSASVYKKPFAITGPATGWVGETATRPQTNSPTLDELSFPTMELYAMPSATQTLLDDSAVNIDEWLAEEIQLAFAQQEGKAFVTGEGGTEPRGFLDYTTVANGSWEWNKIGYIATGNDGTFDTDDPSDDLIDLVYSLKAGYRANASWVMNRATQAAIRKFKDENGNYIWQPGASAGQWPTLMNYPIAESEDMPDIGSDEFAIAFGDFKRGYLVVDRAGIRVLRDPYSVKPYVLFYTTKRVGGGVQDFDAIKLLKFGTS